MEKSTTHCSPHTASLPLWHPAHGQRPSTNQARVGQQGRGQSLRSAIARLTPTAVPVALAWTPARIWLWQWQLERVVKLSYSWLKSRMNWWAAGVTCKGTKRISEQLIQAAALMAPTPRLACGTRGMPFPVGEKRVGGHILLLSLSESQGFKAQAPDSFSQPISTLHSHSFVLLLVLLLLFLLLCCLAVLWCVPCPLPVSLSESELMSESDDFLSLMFLFLSFLKKKIKNSTLYMCICFKKHGM